RTGRNLRSNGTTSMGFDMAKVECYNCHRRGHYARKCRTPKDTRRNVPVETQRRNVPVETSTSNSHYDKLTNKLRESQFDVLSYQTGLESVEARLLVYQQNETVFEENIKLLKLYVELRDKALVDLRKTFKKAEQERDESRLTLENSMFDCDEMFNSKSDESLPASHIYDRYQSREGYHVVPLPYIGTFMPPNPDLVFHAAPNVNEIVHTAFNNELSPTKPDKDSPTHRPSPPIIEDWVSDSEDDSEAKHPYNALSFVQTTKQVKPPKPSVKPVKTSILPANHKTAIPKPNTHGNSRNSKACFGNPQNALKDKGVIDSGCSRHMIGNMSYLSDFEAINGGYAAFGGNPKRGKITDTECLVLSPEFKLPDESHVLLRVPRENNMYNVDLKSIVPFGDLTCIFAKEALDESNLWHRRLGHINFKTMNKLVKDNLVRGLPFKVFENNHTCVECLNGGLIEFTCGLGPEDLSGGLI
nr:ribonuclease H-like domain-containing protein [Tanacetum cinerariifolium]